jgi:hypothetical protein
MTTQAIAIRQNATTTPGASARRTRIAAMLIATMASAKTAETRAVDGGVTRGILPGRPW